MRIAITAFAFFLLVSVASAATIYVPDSYPTIQDAIDGSVAGDTVIVRSGTYYENIDFKGKAIVLVSESGPYETTIDGGQKWSVVVFENGETQAAVIDGFTITNGVGSYLYPPHNEWGGGIRCYSVSPMVYESPTIRNNIIEGNSANNAGGGIYCRYSNAVIENNIIRHNSSWRGAGFMCIIGSPVIRNNTVSGNMAKTGGGIYIVTNTDALIEGNDIRYNRADFEAGGILCKQQSTAKILNNNVIGNWGYYCGGGVIVGEDSVVDLTNCTIVRNSSDFFGGGLSVIRSKVKVTNSIFWQNQAPEGKEIELKYEVGGSYLDISYSDVDGGVNSIYENYGPSVLVVGQGFIDAAPLFADPANNDFHLTWPSPCRNAGDNTAVTELYDFEGDPRIAQGTVDMGADEFYYHLYSVGDVLPGAPIDIKVVGIPGLPALLALGTGIQDPPQSTQHGDLWLKMPLAKSWQLAPIPSTGILTRTATVPSGWTSGSAHPFQALVGPWGGSITKLTNLATLAVE